MTTDQALLNYDELQLTELRQRSEAFAHECFDYALTEFGTNPERYNKHRAELQLKVAKFIKSKVAVIYTQEEMIAEFIAQRAFICLEMMQAMADKEREEKKGKNESRN